MQILKEIWKFLLEQGITITAEHLPGNLNCKADWESRHQKDSSQWKMRPLIFSKICQILGKKPEIDLFASRLSNQLPGYCSWKPNAKRHRCSSTEMVSQESICIPSIYLDSQSTEKSRGGESAFSNNSNSNLANPKLVPRTLTSFSDKSNHFAIKGRLTKGSLKPQHPLTQNQTMQLAVWVASGSVWQRKIRKGCRPYCLINKGTYSLKLLIIGLE